MIPKKNNREISITTRLFGIEFNAKLENKFQEQIRSFDAMPHEQQKRRIEILRADYSVISCDSSAAEIIRENLQIIVNFYESRMKQKYGGQIQ